MAMTIRVFLTALALSATLAPAAHAQSIMISPPTGVTWQLQGVTAQGKLQVLPAVLNRPTLTFTGRSASGFAWCNTLQAAYASRANILRFGQVATTKKACKPIVNTLEKQYLNLLAGTNHYAVSGTSLTLYSGSRSRLVYTQVKAK
jgi:heat shock protein HslJ